MVLSQCIHTSVIVDWYNSPCCITTHMLISLYHGLRLRAVLFIGCHILHWSISCFTIIVATPFGTRVLSTQWHCYHLHQRRQRYKPHSSLILMWPELVTYFISTPYWTITWYGISTPITGTSHSIPHALLCLCALDHSLASLSTQASYSSTTSRLPRYIHLITYPLQLIAPYLLFSLM